MSSGYNNITSQKVLKSVEKHAKKIFIFFFINFSIIYNHIVFVGVRNIDVVADNIFNRQIYSFQSFPRQCNRTQELLKTVSTINRQRIKRILCYFSVCSPLTSAPGVRKTKKKNTKYRLMIYTRCVFVKENIPENLCYRAGCVTVLFEFFTRTRIFHIGSFA